MSWIETNADESHRLRFSRWRGRSWAPGLTISEGDNWFVNWADFPAIASTRRGHLLAGWLQKTGGNTYAYDVRLSHSTDGGETWSSPYPVHDDRSETEHGFLSIAPTSSGQYAACWLDGREMVGEDGPMTLRFAHVDRDGATTGATMLDGRTCECCQTAMTITSKGTTVVAYRGRGSDETRDILCTRLVNDQWSAPRPVHDDGWVIAGCPVNGPQLASSQSLVAAAWFTMGHDETPRVNVAFSDDDGITFKSPVRIDAGDPEGRVDIVFVEDSLVLVSWLESAGARGSDLCVRHVGPGGVRSDSARLARLTSGRATGFARMAVSAEGILIAWTDPRPGGGVQTALITLR